MANITNIATTGLLALQKALSTVGHNIANANTPGYSRQRVHLTSQVPQKLGGSYVGSGVTIQGVERISNEFLNQQLRISQSSFSQYESFLYHADKVDQIFSDDGINIAASMQDFFSSIATANENPSSIPARNTVLSQSEFMVDQISSIYGRLQDYEKLNNFELGEVVNEVNNIAQNIAQLNQQILSLGKGAHDLVDQRDQAILELSKYVSVNTIPQQDGTINVSVGNGQMLVLTGGAMPLSVQSSKIDPANKEIAIDFNGNQTVITNSLSGGRLGGLIEFRERMLKPSMNALGQISLGLVENFNRLHKQGMDANSQLGKNFFNDINSINAQQSRATNHENNSGSANLQIEITNSSQLSLSDYRLTVLSPTDIRVVNLKDNSIQNFNGWPIELDGMRIAVDNPANLDVNDNFLLMPTRNGARWIDMNIKDPSEIALASPVRVEKQIGNIGDGEITFKQVLDSESPDLTKDFTINFITPTQYEIINESDGVNLGTYTLISGTNTIPIPPGSSPAYEIELSGSQQTGDRFSSIYNVNGVGDSRNGLQLSKLQSSRIFSGNSETLFDRHSSLVAMVGGQASQAGINQQASEILLEQSQSQRDSVSAVNLDEEAANLLRFQQAYQAVAKLISVADEIIDIIFSSSR